MLCLILCSGVQASALKIYFDNSQENWETPHIHYWGSSQSTWPGVAMSMSQYENIWEYDVPEGTVGILFNAGGDGNLTKTPDCFDIQDGKVYTRSGCSGKTPSEYLGGGGNTDPDPVDPSGSLYVYCDVPADWTNMYAYVYFEGASDQNYGWPGVAMECVDASTGLWKYEISNRYNGNCYVIFSSRDNGQHRYPAEGAASLEVHGKSMIYHYNGNIWEEYEEEVIPPVEPGNDMEYLLYFHNTDSWNNVYVEISGSNNLLVDYPLSSFLNSSIYDVEFTQPENYTLYCRFYTLDGSSKNNMTSRFPVISGHFYTISGDKGPKDDYDPSDTLPEKEYWLEPEYPTAHQKATLYFNKYYDPNSKLKGVDDIYLYAGLIAVGEENSKWVGAPSWDNPFKMTKDESHDGVYYFEMTPSIEDRFGVDSGISYDRLAVIFRDHGDIKQHEEDLYIPLRVAAPVSEPLGNVQDWEISDNQAVVTSENGKLYLTPWSKNVVKVFTLPSNNPEANERPSVSVIDDELKAKYQVESVSFNSSEDSDYLYFEIPNGVKVAVEKATSLLSFYNHGVSVPALKENSSLSNQYGEVGVSFAGMNDSGFYGGGYNGNLTNWEGFGMVMENNQDGGWSQGSRLSRNIGIPFYVSTEGYGVYFDDHTLRATIYPSRLGTTYTSSSRNPIAYYFVGGGDMVSVVENYTELTGKQELPPYWALGYITSKFSFQTRTEAEETIAKTKAVNIPVDGIVFDIHWQTGQVGEGTCGMGKIDWERSAYPNPEEMMANFRKQNVHTIAITEPYFTSRSGNYDFLKNNGYLADDHVNYMEWLQSEHVGLLDITNQGAVDWFKDLYKKRTAEGIESWWLDLGEPEKHDSDSRYSDGSTVEQIQNEYGLIWNQLAFDAVKEQTPDTRFITMPRAGTSGMQRYNAFPWTGDIARSWEGLMAQVPALVSAAMSGVSYLGSDIGGFTSQGANANLYRRWVQLGVFYPSMRTHSSECPEVWQSCYDNVRDDVRNAINLRYAYLPYTYTQSFLYTAFGTPIARPANYADENKATLANEIGSYLWGPDIFVAPVLDDSSFKSITFPEGEWLDMNDMKTVYGSHQHITYHAPTNILPHFMRKGSFVTRYAQDTFTSTAEINRHELIVDFFAPDTDEEVAGYFYDDDHTTVDPLSSGKYLLTHFYSHAINSHTNSPTSFVIDVVREGDGFEGMPETQDFLFRIHNFKVNSALNDPLQEGQIRILGLDKGRAQSRRVEGKAADDYEGNASAISSKESIDELKNASDPGFYHDVENGKMYVRIPNVSTSEPMWLSMGAPSIPTSIDAPAAFGLMTLSYGAGYLTYCAPQEADDLRIEIYSSTGALISEYTQLSATGTASQIALDLPSGVYVAKLIAKDSHDNHATRTAKIIF